MKRIFNVPLIALAILVVTLVSCGSSRSTTSRYPYPGSTYPYPGSTYPYPESNPYPRTYPTARYPRQSPPVVVYRQPSKVYVPADTRRNDRRDDCDDRNRHYKQRKDHNHRNDYNKGQSKNRNYSRSYSNR